MILLVEATFGEPFCHASMKDWMDIWSVAGTEHVPTAALGRHASTSTETSTALARFEISRHSCIAVSLTGRSVLLVKVVRQCRV